MVSTFFWSEALLKEPILYSSVFQQLLLHRRLTACGCAGRTQPFWNVTRRWLPKASLRSATHPGTDRVGVIGIFKV